MTATPGAAPTAGKPANDPTVGKPEKAPSKFLAGIKRAGLGLVKVAVDQFKANPAVAVTAIARVATGLATKLPPKVGGPATSLIAVVAAATIKSAVTPAQPAVSAVQTVVSNTASSVSSALDRLNRARGR